MLSLGIAMGYVDIAHQQFCSRTYDGDEHHHLLLHSVTGDAFMPENLSIFTLILRQPLFESSVFKYCGLFLASILLKVWGL